MTINFIYVYLRKTENFVALVLKWNLCGFWKMARIAGCLFYQTRLATVIVIDILMANTFKYCLDGCLLELYILATLKVIWGWVPTCDSTLPWRLRLGLLLCVHVRVSGKHMHSFLALVAPLMRPRLGVSWASTPALTYVCVFNQYKI